jgi:hypothetical protein
MAPLEEGVPSRADLRRESYGFRLNASIITGRNWSGDVVHDQSDLAETV